MKPILPPTFVTEIDRTKNRLSNVERLQADQEQEQYGLNKPASITFIKYARDNSAFSEEDGPSKIDRIQSQWVSFPYSIKIYSVYVTHKTEHMKLNAPQDFYRCQIVTKTNDLQPDVVLNEFNVSLNKFNWSRSNENAGLWQDTPLESENLDQKTFFQYNKQIEIEIKLSEPITIKPNQRFSLIKTPVFASNEEFDSLEDQNLDIDVMVFKGVSTEPINATVHSMLIKEPINFVSGSSSLGFVNDFVVDNQGKYLIVGDFKFAGNRAVNNIVRVNADGTIDNSFKIEEGPNREITKVKVQSDGKILCLLKQLFTQTTTWNGIDFPKMVRLNSDGSLDECFMAAGPPEGITQIEDFTVMPDDRILVRRQLALGPRFVLLDRDGKIIRLVDITAFEGPTQNITGDTVRMNWLSTIDQDNVFVWGADNFKGRVWKFNIETGVVTRIPLNGNYTFIGMVDNPLNEPAKIDSGHHVFPTSYVEPGAPGGVLKISPTLDAWTQFTDYELSATSSIAADCKNKIMLAGTSINKDGQFIGSVIRMDKNGELDETFDASQSISQAPDPGFNPQKNRIVKKIIALSNNQYLIGGNFTTSSEGRQNFVRLNEDGSIDTGFNIL